MCKRLAFAAVVEASLKPFPYQTPQHRADPCLKVGSDPAKLRMLQKPSGNKGWPGEKIIGVVVRP
jgi:hypothetical protein